MAAGAAASDEGLVLIHNLDDPAGFIDRSIGGDTSGIDDAIAELERDANPDSDGGPGAVDS